MALIFFYILILPLILSFTKTEIASFAWYTSDREEIFPVPRTRNKRVHRVDKCKSSVQWSSGRCRKMTEKQKFQCIESEGGRNQRFTANSAEEAGRNFHCHLTESERHKKSVEDYYRKNGLAKTDKCDEHCQVTAKQISKDMKGLDSLAKYSSAEKGRGCRLEHFIPIGNCTQKGDEYGGRLEKLCTTCEGVYVLGPNCFPKLLNAVTCGDSGGESVESCIFSNARRHISHGRCRSQTVSMKVLRNVGSADCEDWKAFSLDVPVACECYLDASDVCLAPSPPRSALFKRHTNWNCC